MQLLEICNIFFGKKFWIYTSETKQGTLKGKIYKLEKYSDGETDCFDRFLLHDILDCHICIMIVKSASAEFKHMKVFKGD